MPTFTFTTSITKGRNDTEYDVEVTYSAERKGPVEIIDAKCPVHLTDEDFDHLTDIAADRANDDYAEWLADYGDYLHEQRRDRAAMSYVPAGAL